MNHPHDSISAIPERIPVQDLKNLSELSSRKAIVAIISEWLFIFAIIGFTQWVNIWPAYILAVFLIGARQHALTVIAHDAAHFRLFPNRWVNDWVGNVFLAWPMFISIQGFRHFHGDHHRFLNGEKDGNRLLWSTHNKEGNLNNEWRYPKTPLQFVTKIIKRVFFLTGVFWILRGLIGGFMYGASIGGHITRIALWGFLFFIINHFSAWYGFLFYWILPYCTWHVAAQYIRLSCEHSAIFSDNPQYRDTRSTIPGWLGRLFILPRNIGYHIEHHWYPSVPFYNLPLLHKRLIELSGFKDNAQYNYSILDYLRDIIKIRNYS